MTATITIKWAQPGTTEPLVAQDGAVQVTPMQGWIAGDTIVNPRSRSYTISGGTTTIEIDDSAERVWKFVNKPTGMAGWTEYKLVPAGAGEVLYTELTSVDEKSAKPTAPVLANAIEEVAKHSITSGTVIGDTLVLTRGDGTSINAGNVKGPAGEVDLNALDDRYVQPAALSDLATKDELPDLSPLATKSELEPLAAKTDIAPTVADEIDDPDSEVRARLNAASVDLGGQPDFVEAARRFSPYNSLEIHKVDAANTLDVICRGATGHVIHQVSANGQYQFISRVWEGSDVGPAYDPGVGNVALDRGERDATVRELTLTGTWNTPNGSYWDTTEVGATWETTLTVETRSTVAMRHRKTPKGGLWRVEVVGGQSTEVTNWVAVAVHGVTYDVLTLPDAGTYTLRGTFLGDDPNHAPDGGTAYGYLTQDSGSFFVSAVPLVPAKTNALCAANSNKNYAIAMASNGGPDEFAPQHGTVDTETVVTPPVYYTGATVLDVDAMAVGDIVQAGSLTIVQHIRAHNTYAPSVERLDIQTRDRIDADGTYTMEGVVRTLAPLDASKQMYFGMLVGNPQLSDTVVTSFRNGYPATVEMANGRETPLPEREARYAKSVAMVGSQHPDLVTAITYDTPAETRRANTTDETPLLFIQHRDSLTTKVYPNLGYVDGEPIPAGVTWRFAARMWHGRSPGIRAAIMP